MYNKTVDFKIIMLLYYILNQSIVTINRKTLIPKLTISPIQDFELKTVKAKLCIFLNVHLKLIKIINCHIQNQSNLPKTDKS